VWDDLQAGWLLGSDRFLDEIRPLLREKPPDPEYRKRERLLARPSLDELFMNVTDKATRDERIHEAVRVHRYTLKEVGGHVGLLYSTVSVIAKRLDEKKRTLRKVLTLRTLRTKSEGLTLRTLRTPGPCGLCGLCRGSVLWAPATLNVVEHFQCLTSPRRKVG
jgi:predicted metal-binding protein